MDGRSNHGFGPLRRLAAGLLGGALMGALIAPGAVLGVGFTPTNDLITTTEDHAPVNGNLLSNDGDAARSAGLHIETSAAGSITVAADGEFEFTPAADWSGTNILLGWYFSDPDQLNNGNDILTYIRVTVGAVNDVPSFTKGANQSVAEDAGARSVSGWASAVSAGPGEGGQVLAFHATTDNNALFSVLPAIAANGTLSYTPAANASGSATVTAWLTDNGGTADGGDDTSADQTFTITVGAVNDVPSFTKGANQSVAEDAGARSVSGWASAVSAGPGEGGQVLAFHATTDNNALFSVLPAIAANGTLSYTPAANASGSATVTAWLTDNGGTADGGDDTSADQTFTITVGAVNDVPSFTKGANQSVAEDAGARSVSGWASAVSAGPGEGGQVLAFHATTDNNALFSVLPAIAANGTLSYTPAANASGSATVTAWLTDNGGTADGGDDTSADQTFTITVGAVNDVPSFTKGANQSVAEDAGARSVSGWASAVSAGPGEGGQVLAFHATTDNNALFSVLPAIAANGTLSYTPAANASGSATVTAWLTDNGGTADGGDDTSADQTFTITVGAVNDVPVAASQAVGVIFNTAKAITLGGSDIEGDQLTYVILDGPHHGLLAGTGTHRTYTPTANTHGADSFTFRVSDGHAVSNVATVSITVTNDAVPPTIGTPTVTFGTGRVNESAPLTVSWPAAVDAGVGVKAYELQAKVGTGAWTMVHTGIDRTFTKAYAFGTDLQWRVRASDLNDNWSGWQQSAIRRLVAFQGGAPATHSGRWTTIKTASASGDRYKYTTRAGRYQNLAFTGLGVLYVAPTRANAGWVKVRIDRTTVRRNLHTATTKPGVIVTAMWWGTSGSHTIRVTNSQAGKRATFDAFIVLR